MLLWNLRSLATALRANGSPDTVGRRPRSYIGWGGQIARIDIVGEKANGTIRQQAVHSAGMVAGRGKRSPIGIPTALNA